MDDAAINNNDIDNENNNEANDANEETNEENEDEMNEANKENEDETNEANEENEVTNEATVNDPILETVDENDDAIETKMDAKYGTRSREHNLCVRRPRDYSHLHVTLESTVMTQHSMKQGIKLFGDAGIEAVLKELKQLHDRKVLEPADAEKLSKDEKRAALQYIMFLKKKGSGVIKGRGCADGRKQRPYTRKILAHQPW